MKVETIEQLAEKLARGVRCWRVAYGFFPVENRIVGLQEHNGKLLVKCAPAEGYGYDGAAFLIEFGNNELNEFCCEEEKQPKRCGWESNPKIGECVEWGFHEKTYTIEVKHGEVWKPTGVEGTLAECERRIAFYPEKVRIVEIRRRVVLIREKRL